MIKKRTFPPVRTEEEVAADVLSKGNPLKNLIGKKITDDYINKSKEEDEEADDDNDSTLSFDLEEEDEEDDDNDTEFLEESTTHVRPSIHKKHSSKKVKSDKKFYKKTSFIISVMLILVSTIIIIIIPIWKRASTTDSLAKIIGSRFKQTDTELPSGFPSTEEASIIDSNSSLENSEDETSESVTETETSATVTYTWSTDLIQGEIGELVIKGVSGDIYSVEISPNDSPSMVLDLGSKEIDIDGTAIWKWRTNEQTNTGVYKIKIYNSSTLIKEGTFNVTSSTMQ